MTPLPMTVFGGYLGAGKTTLINQILRDPKGKRILVLVNDFGDINIDADLLISADEDTMVLANGCVCCTMGGDLFMALADAVDRRPRPDHLIVEASGIADPARIAAAANSEPDLSYAGIVTVVDGVQFAHLSADPQIGAQVQGQVAVADLAVITKTHDDTLIPQLYLLGARDVALADQIDISAHILEAAGQARIPQSKTGGHPEYISQTAQGLPPRPLDQIEAALDDLPTGIFRLKGFLQNVDGSHYEVHKTGRARNIRLTADHDPVLLVIGLKDRFDMQLWRDWLSKYFAL